MLQKPVLHELFVEPNIVTLFCDSTSDYSKMPNEWQTYVYRNQIVVKNGKNLRLFI